MFVMMKLTTFVKRVCIGLYLCICGTVLLASSPVLAGEADVLDVKVVRAGADMYRFSVTVSHTDTGWDHYADKWEVLDLQGNVLAARVLMHPHVDEQPFTRSMKISIPMHIKRVRIRAHDSVHGYGGALLMWICQCRSGIDCLHFCHNYL